MLNLQSVNICIFILFIILFETYGNNNATNLHIKINETSSNSSITTSNIASEGGIVTVSDTNLKNKIENTLPKPTIKNSTVLNTTSVSNMTIVHEREGFTIKTSTITPIKTSVSINITLNTSTTEKIIPVSEAEAPLAVNVTNKQSSTTEKIEITGDSKIKPRKGVEYIIENVTSTTTKPKKMKPTVTVGSDDDDNNLAFIAHRNSKKDNSSILKTEGILNGKYKPDYVLPIVMSILAVPLLAIIIAVLYKRSAEWWQHRHYRRMDFLIDGMYNN